MSDEIVVITPRDLNETKSLAKDLSASALMPQALRRKPEDIMAIVMTGAELGLAPMQAIRGINIINGRVSLSADLMGALVKRQSDVCEFLQLVESTSTRATYKTKRKGNPEATTMTFTIEDAQAAGLTGNMTYKKHPAAMLRARCLSAICRAEYQDLCMGLYDESTEELPEEEKDVTPQQAHVQQLKTQLREIVDAEIVPTMTLDGRIEGAASVEELTSLIPEIGQQSEEEKTRLRPLYAARKEVLCSSS
jgi:hypothetical protein